MDMLLWRGLAAEAERLMPRVSPDWQALAAARLGLRAGVDGVDGLIARVPQRLASTRASPGNGSSGASARAATMRWR